MTLIKLISEVDYFDDYNYLIDFDDYMTESGIPIFVFDTEKNKYSYDSLKQLLVKILNNIPKLKYQFDIVNENNKKYKLLKIKYFKKCNKRIIDVLIELLKNQHLTVYTSNDIYVPTARSLIKYTPSALVGYGVHSETGIINFTSLTEQSKFKIVFERKYEYYIQYRILLHLNEPENILYLRYDKDNEYWNLSKTKQPEKTDSIQLMTIKRELDNIKMKNDLSALKNIQISDLLKPEQQVKTRDTMDNVKYIYDLIKKIFIYLNNNAEEIKRIVLNLQSVVVDLKDMYSKLELKQSEVENKNSELEQELYEKNLPKAEQKKLEEERKRKAEEEKKLEEERKQKAEETKKAIESLNMIASLCGADLSNDPDMKDILTMYGSLNSDNKKEEKKE